MPKTYKEIGRNNNRKKPNKAEKKKFTLGKNENPFAMARVIFKSISDHLHYAHKRVIIIDHYSTLRFEVNEEFKQLFD